MVTRKPAFEKQEHGLFFTFKLADCLNFTQPSASPMPFPERANSRTDDTRMCRRCNEAIPELPVSRQIETL
jgi:hypothetical protein